MLNDASGFKRIFLAAGFTDLRRGIDGLAGIIQFQFELDPHDKDTIFLFCGRRNDRIKALLVNAPTLTLNFCGTRDMYKIYHFDVQFSGSDYEHDPSWLAEKEWLEKNGSTMIFFPYTQSTSSTKLKKAIESKIKD